MRFVLPLILRRVNGIDLLESSDLGVSDYAAPVVDRDWWENLGEKETLHRAVSSVLPSHDLMRLRPLRPEHVALWQTLMGGKARPLPFSAHATCLSPSMEMWRARALDPAFDRYLSRRRKRLFKQPDARCRILTMPEEITTAIAAIARLRAGRFSGDIIQSPAALRFYTQVAIEGAACGQARTYALELGGEPIGYTFALTRANQLHYLLIGCDYERHGRHSPGLVLYDAMIGDWIGQGGTEFDFTIGDEPFKADFGTVATPMSEIVEARSWRGSLAQTVWTLRQAWRTSRPASPPASGANPITDTDKER